MCHTSRVISCPKLSECLVTVKPELINEYIFIMQTACLSLPQVSLFWTSLNECATDKPATNKGANNHLIQTVLCCNINPHLQYQTGFFSLCMNISLWENQWKNKLRKYLKMMALYTKYNAH